MQLTADGRNFWIIIIIPIIINTDSIVINKTAGLSGLFAWNHLVYLRIKIYSTLI